MSHPLTQAYSKTDGHISKASHREAFGCSNYLYVRCVQRDHDIQNAEHERTIDRAHHAEHVDTADHGETGEPRVDAALHLAVDGRVNQPARGNL